VIVDDRDTIELFSELKDDAGADSDSGESTTGSIISGGVGGEVESIAKGPGVGIGVVSFDDAVADGMLSGAGLLPKIALAVEVVLSTAPSVLKGGGVGKEPCLDTGPGEGDRLRDRLNIEPRLTWRESLLW